MTELMSRAAVDLTRAAAIAALLVLPFAFLQARNGALTSGNAAGLTVLFTLLWLLPAAAVFLGTRVVRGAMPLPGRLAATAFILALVMIWMAIVVDQMPCFLGVPNCD
jgi:hypothetical protein